MDIFGTMFGAIAGAIFIPPGIAAEYPVAGMTAEPGIAGTMLGLAPYIMDA